MFCPLDSCSVVIRILRGGSSALNARLSVCSMGCMLLGFSVVNMQCDDVACDRFRGAPQEQGRGIREQIVAEEVISKVDEEVFVAKRQHGRMCTEKGLWLACESAGKQHGWTCPQPHSNALVFFMLDSLIIETQKSSHWNGKRRHCLGPWSLFDPVRCAHLSLNELKIDRSLLTKPLHAQKVFPMCFFHCTSKQRFVSRGSSSSVDLDSSSLDDVRPERAAIALSVGQSWPPVKRRSAGRPWWCPSAHTRGDRPYQHSLCPSSTHSSRCPR